MRRKKKVDDVEFDVKQTQTKQNTIPVAFSLLAYDLKDNKSDAAKEWNYLEKSGSKLDFYNFADDKKED